MKKWILLTLLLPVLVFGIGSTTRSKKMDVIEANTASEITLQDDVKLQTQTPDSVPYTDSGNIIRSSSINQAELEKLEGITVNVQDELDLKLERALTDGYMFLGNGTGNAVGVLMSGEASTTNLGVVTLDNDSVIAKLLSGFTSGAGAITSADSLLSSVQKLDGNIGLKQDEIIATTSADYYRGDKTFQTLDSSVVPENTNLYFTDTRSISSPLTGYTSGAGTVVGTDSIIGAIEKLNGNAGLKEDSILAGTTLEYWRGDKSFQTLDTLAVPENTNLYFTDARSIASPLTGYVSGAGTVADTDSILESIEKLNGNILLKEDSISGTANEIDVTASVVGIVDNAILPGTDAFIPPKGTTAQRIGTTAGMFRFNSDDDSFEGYTTGAGWGPIGGVAEPSWELVGNTLTANGILGNSGNATYDVTLFSKGETYQKWFADQNRFYKRLTPSSNDSLDIGQAFLSFKDIYLDDVKFYNGGNSLGHINTSSSTGMSIRNDVIGASAALRITTVGGANDSAPIRIDSGASSSGDSGDVTLEIGDAFGSLGFIKFITGEGANSIGDLWTATGVNGEGHWETPVPPVLATAKGNLLTNNGAIQAEFPACPDGFTIVWDSTESLGFKCDAVAGADITVVGQILSSASVNVPDGFLYCDGSSLLRTAYPELFAEIGTAYGAVDGTHFNLPDLRGMFLRGQSDGTGQDPDAGSRFADNAGGNTGDNIGSQQVHALESHNHTFVLRSNSHVVGGNVPKATNPAAGGSDSNYPTNSVGASSETRPENIYVRYYIRFAPAIGLSSGVPLMAKGSIFTSDGSDNGEYLACPNEEILIFDSAETSGLKCGTAGGGGDLWSDPVDASIIPTTTNLYDLGSDTKTFKRVHVNEAIRITDGINTQMHLASEALGVLLRSFSGDVQMQPKTGEQFLITASADLAKLSAQPTGGTALSIATTGYIDGKLNLSNTSGTTVVYDTIPNDATAVYDAATVTITANGTSPIVAYAHDTNVSSQIIGGTASTEFTGTCEVLFKYCVGLSCGVRVVKLQHKGLIFADGTMDHKWAMPSSSLTPVSGNTYVIHFGIENKQTAGGTTNRCGLESIGFLAKRLEARQL